MWDKRNAYRTMMGKPEGHMQDLGVDWTDLAHDRDTWRALVNTVMNLRIPQNGVGRGSGGWGAG